MTQKIIYPEDMMGGENQAFQRLLALVPAEERTDTKLKRFLAFRLRIDGEDATRAYLLKGIEHARESAFKGTLYEYLMDREATFSGEWMDNIPPDEPG